MFNSKGIVWSKDGHGADLESGYIFRIRI